MSDAPDTLEDLVRDWSARPSPERLFVPPTSIPGPLGARITRREPYRARVIADAALLLAFPAPIGWGMERMVEADPEAPFDGWDRTHAHVRIRAAWSEDMSGTRLGQGCEEIRRVAFENGRWKVVELLTDAARDELRMLLTFAQQRR